MTVATAVLDRARARPSGTAVVTDLGTTTNAALAERVTARRRELAAAGIRPGEIVPIVERDPAAALAEALALDAVDAVPLVGDVRWTPQYASAALSRLGIPGALASRPGWAAFSSGSTGDPRVILRGRDSWLESFEPLSAILGLTGDDAVLVPVSLVSSLSVFAAMHALSAGCAVVAPSDGSDAALAAVIPAATVVHSTPTALMRILDLIDAGAASALRLALVGGAPLTAPQRARARERGIRVVPYYGAAELSFVAIDSDGRGLHRFPGVEWRIDLVPDTDVGTLAVRSPYLADGYLGAGGSLRLVDGWASVGDLVTRPGPVADGLERLELRGRGDGAILTADATVVPEDVEAVVRALSGIRDAVVFGMPHARLGAIVCVVVETSDAAGPAERAAWRAECRRRLTISQNPRRWYATGQLERTDAGKPARARIVADVLSGAAGVRRLG